MLTLARSASNLFSYNTGNFIDPLMVFETVNTCIAAVDTSTESSLFFGATATWVLGLPHGLAVLHGKTRRGGLVFDVADLVKDAVILPQAAFISTMRGDTKQEFQQACIESLTSSESPDFMIDTLKAIALKIGRLAQAQPQADA